MDGLVSGIFHNAVETKMDFLSHFGVSCASQPIQRGAVPPRPPSSITPPPAIRGTYDWYVSKASLHDCCGIQFCIDEQTERPRYIGMLLYYGQGCQEALGQLRWDLTVTKMVLPSQTQYYNHFIEGKHYIRWKLSEMKDEYQSETCWKALPSSGILLWWFGRQGEQLQAVKADLSA
jgi:hypothetical protein